MLHNKMLHRSICVKESAMFMTIVAIVFLGSVVLGMYMDLKG